MNDNNQYLEKIFFQEKKVTVTQSRYIIEDKTFVVRNISSVSLDKVIKSRIGALILIIAGITIFFLWEPFWIGIVLTVVGCIWLIFIRDEFAVKIGTNGGEVNSLISKDKAFIEKVVKALNDAIVYRG